jgi:hypothetical protein
LLLALLPARSPHAGPAATGHHAPASAAATSPGRPGGRRWPLPRLTPAAAPAPVQPAPAPDDPLARGLVAHWRFDDGAGSPVARDASGRGRDCLLHDLDPAAAWGDGVSGGAVSLTGGGWLECPLPEVQAGVPLQMSVTAWVRRTARREGNAALFTRQLPGGDAQHLFWFGLAHIGPQDRGRDRLQVWSGSWTGWTTKLLASPDRWMHVAFVHQDRVTRLYRDGNLVGQHHDGRPRGTQGLVTGALTIGGGRYLGDPLRVRSPFTGLLDEARIYDRALDDAQVAALARRMTSGAIAAK